MKIRPSTRAATLMLLATGVFGPAWGDGAPPPLLQMNGFAFCSAGPEAGGCGRFQGYIYVGHAAAHPAPAGVASTPPDNPALGDERLYIHLDGADAR